MWKKIRPAWESAMYTLLRGCVCISRSAVSDSVARQASLSMKLCRQEYWSGLPFPFPEDLPDLRGYFITFPKMQTAFWFPSQT